MSINTFITFTYESLEVLKGVDIHTYIILLIIREKTNTDLNTVLYGFALLV